MESRLSELFQLICTTDSSYLVGNLSILFKVSDRTILNDIEKINEYLEKKSLPKITIENKLISYPTILHLSFADILTHKSELVFLDGEFRKKQLLLDCLLDLENFSIVNLTQKYSLSRNTIIKEIKDIRALLLTQNIELKPIAFKGYALIGDEKNIRKLAASLYAVAKVNIFDSISFVELCAKIEQLLNQLFSYLDRRVAQTAFDRLISYFWVSTCRYNRGNYINDSTSLPIETLEKRLLSESDIFQKLFKNGQSLSNEITYLADKLTEASLISPNESISDDWLSWNFITIDFINSVSEFAQISYFNSDIKLFEGILTHLQPAVSRLQNNEELKNPLYHEVITRFNILNNAVLKALPYLELKLGVGFTLQESSYLTLFFAASLQRKQFQNRSLKNIIVVCNEGISTSQILTSRLQGLFNFHIIGTFSIREVMIWQKSNQADLIISTIDIPDAKFPVIKVNPFLTGKDIEEIQKNTNTSLKQIHIDDILSVIKKNVLLTEKQEEFIYFDLESLLQGSLIQKNSMKESYEPMLIEVLTKKTIEANFPAKNREEAVREAGKLLVESGSASASYIDGMLENVEINGTYIVIAPGIAMPHARPEKGALKIGFSLVTLDQPVVFGHPTNDPVKLVIGLCATDHQKHLKALSELVELLSNNETVNKIIIAQSNEEIYQIIKGEMNYD